MNRPMRLCGVPVTIAEPFKCQKLVKRTWKERLLSWTPWEAYRTEYTLVDTLKDGQILKAGNSMVMNAATWKQAVHAMEQPSPFEDET